jgi:hypothetical protein
MPSIDAAAHDARFIYDAIDAAKSLLTRVNEFVSPETLRYMPCTYYLFIIYSAVFLYKVSYIDMASMVETNDFTRPERPRRCLKLSAMRSVT